MKRRSFLTLFVLGLFPWRAEAKPTLFYGGMVGGGMADLLEVNIKDHIHPRLSLAHEEAVLGHTFPADPAHCFCTKCGWSLQVIEDEQLICGEQPVHDCLRALR